MTDQQTQPIALTVKQMQEARERMDNRRLERTRQVVPRDVPGDKLVPATGAGSAVAVNSDNGTLYANCNVMNVNVGSMMGATVCSLLLTGWGFLKGLFATRARVCAMGVLLLTLVTGFGLYSASAYVNRLWTRAFGPNPQPAQQQPAQQQTFNAEGLAQIEKQITDMGYLVGNLTAQLSEAKTAFETESGKLKDSVKDLQDTKESLKDTKEQLAKAKADTVVSWTTVFTFGGAAAMMALSKAPAVIGLVPTMLGRRTGNPVAGAAIDRANAAAGTSTDAISTGMATQAIVGAGRVVVNTLYTSGIRK